MLSRSVGDMENARIKSPDGLLHPTAERISRVNSHETVYLRGTLAAPVEEETLWICMLIYRDARLFYDELPFGSEALISDLNAAGSGAIKGQHATTYEKPSDYRKTCCCRWDTKLKTNNKQNSLQL